MPMSYLFCLLYEVVGTALSRANKGGLVKVMKKKAGKRVIKQ